jgi:hypothetical protein
MTPSFWSSPTFFISCLLVSGTNPLWAANLSERLLTQKPDVLAAQATMRGDPIRGSIVFHTSAAYGGGPLSVFRNAS